MAPHLWAWDGCAPAPDSSSSGVIKLAEGVVSKLLIGFLLGNDLITVSTTDSLAWLPLIIQWAAMLEAPIRMMIGKERR